MTVTGINYKLMVVSSIMDKVTEAEIPLTGNASVITTTTRESYETKIKKYNLSKDAIDQYTALIKKYNLTELIGKDTPAPEISDGSSNVCALLTLRSDDGTTGKITLMEKPAGINAEAATEFRMLFLDLAKDENKISEETVYPSLKECREIKEEHGPVVAVEMGSTSHGMMYNSNQSTTQIIEKVKEKDNTVLVTIKKQAGNKPEATGSNETSSDIISKIQEISDRENLPGWNYACVDPSIPVDRSMIPTDYSSNTWLNIYYDDSLISGCPRVKRTIGEKACSMGGANVYEALRELIIECIAKSGVTVEMPQVTLFDMSNGMPVTANPQPCPNAFMGMGMAAFATMPQTPDTSANTQEDKTGTENPDGTWDCKCGAKKLTGKFCCECGFPRS
ncbi:MAG: hypothetical protein IKE92_01130 [Clostridiales bacterium]|nr:hypothetical protein [Clostridiales bacterium]